MNIKHLILTGIILILAVTAFSQNKKVKYGKPDKELFSKQHSLIDSTAAAEIIYDKGYSYFIYDNAKESFILTYERFFRIKVYDKNNFDYGEHKINIYKNASDVESLNISAVTLIMEDGKVKKTKLNQKSNIYVDETNNHINIHKISFPAIQDGVVIDCKYTISSTYYLAIQDWQFQYKNLPVVHSEYKTQIPEFYNYNITIKGFENVNVEKKTNNIEETFSIYWETVGLENKKSSGYNILTSNSTITKWSANNIPPFIAEEYITTSDDYTTSVNYELSYIQYRGGKKHSYSRTWEKVADKLRVSNSFGGKINKRASKIVETLITDSMTTKEKIYIIYDYVQKNTAWNRVYDKYSDKTTKFIFSGEKVTTADINLLLIGMLRSANIDANPVLLSTRNNGKIFKVHPTIDKFNYVIARVKLNNEYIFLDATNDFCTPGMLPHRCLNETGFLLKNEYHSLVNITMKESEKQTQMYELKISEDGNIIGRAKHSLKGYAAYDARVQNFNVGDTSNFEIAYKKANQEIELNNFKVENLNNPTKDVNISYNLETSDLAKVAGNMIYLSPLIGETLNENPFKLDERKYPIDFAYNKDITIICMYEIPENYEVIEVPKNTAFALPEKSATYKYYTQIVGNKIQVMSKFKINKPVFHYNEYGALKNFYNMVIAKQKEQIVLKKKAK